VSRHAYPELPADAVTVPDLIAKINLPFDRSRAYVGSRSYCRSKSLHEFIPAADLIARAATVGGVE
jgi:hypothetical protein